jgi:hypothetical protein
MAAWLKDQLLFRWQQLQSIVDLDLHKIPVPSAPLETQTVCAQAICTSAKDTTAMGIEFSEFLKW